jgi:hypothetical protein
MKKFTIMLENEPLPLLSASMHKAVSVLALFFALFCCSHVMGQGTVDPSRVNWDVFNLVSDVDYAMLPALFGGDPTVNPTSYTDTPGGWSGSVGGTYLGTALSFGYTGLYNTDTSGLTWTGAGSYGSASFTSTGSGVSSGLALAISGSGSLGSDLWSWQGTLNYSADLQSLTGTVSLALDEPTDGRLHLFPRPIFKI